MMMRKTMLLAAAALSVVAFAALPSMASAFTTTPAITLIAPASFPQAYTATSGAGTLYTASGRKVTCESSSTAGSYTDAHTGSATITFVGCKESILSTKCTSAGEAAGTIMTETLPTHTVYLKPANAANPHERPGILFTPNETTGKFADFTCAGGVVKISVKGTGVLGTVTEPTIGGAESNTAKIKVEATAAGQEHTETQEGTKYGLESNTNGGAFEPAFEAAGVATATLSGGAKAKTTTGTP